jgi:hypothetical protein
VIRSYSAELDAPRSVAIRTATFQPGDVAALVNVSNVELTETQAAINRRFRRIGLINALTVEMAGGPRRISASLVLPSSHQAGSSHVGRFPGIGTMRVDWEIIAVEQPDLSINSVSFLGEGWCSRSYLVNDELVFRFPKRPEQWVELDREVRFLAFAAERLPLAVPRYLHVVRYSKAAPYGYAVYRYLCGHSMDLSVLGAGKTAAVDTLAAFLRALHSLDPDPDLRAVLPSEDERTGQCCKAEVHTLTPS